MRFLSVSNVELKNKKIENMGPRQCNLCKEYRLFDVLVRNVWHIYKDLKDL